MHKNLHFTFDNETYKQTDGVALVGIIMVELKNVMVPRL